MKRRTFIKGSVQLTLGTVAAPYLAKAMMVDTGELLYNGIRLAEEWPPKYMDPASFRPMPVPYLKNIPKVIPVHVGRQLLFDDFLIEKTDLQREFHQPKKYENNPVFKPETPLEDGYYGVKTAAPKDGGVWWDPKDRKFKMWYEAGWMQDSAYAESRDGLTWERPIINKMEGNNRILSYLVSDSTTVFLDHFTDNPKERFKMFLRPSNTPGVRKGFCMVSEDGINWSLPIQTGFCGDRSTIFYNPFRKKWIYSIRSDGSIGSTPIGRARYYHEHDDFLKGARWDHKKIVFWTGADELDEPDPDIGDAPQLYNLSAVGYESIMLGLHEIHLGPKNEICASIGSPKITELKISFSRDGFHWDRPSREAFIKAERKDGFWDKGYVQSVGGICNIIGDKLWFHYSGVAGNSQQLNADFYKNGMHYGCSMGVAVLRRDGFASMNAGSKQGELLTRPVTFTGQYLFVNVDCPKGTLRVEVLDMDNKVIDGFNLRNCQPLAVDSTIQQVQWKKDSSLARLAGKEVRFRFILQNGKLYSFWISDSENGRSNGYLAAGGPGYQGGTDIEGIAAYEAAKPYDKI